MKKNLTNRIYIYDNFTENNHIILSDKNSHYLISVLRQKLGSYIRIFNENIGEYLAKIVNINRKEVTLSVENSLRQPQITPKLTIAPCLIKNDRFSTMIDMAVQLGISHIIPVISERTIHRNYKEDRLKAIIIEATEQSERLAPTALLESSALNKIEYKNFDAVIYANEKETNNEMLDKSIIKEKNILLITGPEGGFTKEELEFLEKLPNSYSVSLGKNILRAETAMLKLISYIDLLRSYD